MAEIIISMNNNYPPGFENDAFAPYNAPEHIDDIDIAEFIDDNLTLLREYHADHIASPDILDDDLVDEFEKWVVTLSEQQLLTIVNK